MRALVHDPVLAELRQRVDTQADEISCLREERRVLTHRVEQLEDGIALSRAMLADALAPHRLVARGDGSCVIEPIPAPPPPPPLPPAIEQSMRTMARFHPMLLTWRQLAAVTQIDLEAASVVADARRATRRGLLTRTGDLVGLTHAGFEALGVDPLDLPRERDPAELLVLWRDSLPLPADRMLVALSQAAPDALTRAELAGAAGIRNDTGHFWFGLRVLRANGLLLETKGSDELRLAPAYWQPE